MTDASAGPDFRTREECRVCGSPALTLVMDLGEQCIAGIFPKPGTGADRRYPLQLVWCDQTKNPEGCGLLQLRHSLRGDLLYGSYWYRSGINRTMTENLHGIAREASELVGGLQPGDLVVDIGCNDGLFLGKVRERGGRALGVEPAANIAEMAREKGVEVENVYFGTETAKALREKHGAASVITTTNTFNHIDDLHGFMRGVDTFLSRDGAFIVEVPQALTYVAHNEFDTVYHEHLSTFSVTSLAKLSRFFDLRIVDVQELPIHGGSMRVVAQRTNGASGETPVAQTWLDKERDAGLFERKTYDDFAGRVHRIREELMTMLRRLKAEGKSLAGYGAPAKGNTLLNYYGIGTDLLQFLADRNPLKQGKLSPGMHIPVVPAERVLEAQPDYLLILAWNFGDEIMQQQAEYARRGGKFILPIPEPRIV